MGAQQTRQLPDHAAFKLPEPDHAAVRSLLVVVCVTIFVVACWSVYHWQHAKVHEAERRLEYLQLHDMDMHRQFDLSPNYRSPGGTR